MPKIAASERDTSFQILHPHTSREGRSDRLRAEAGLMAIRQLEVRDYRSFHGTIWRPGNLNLLVGPNGSGKSKAHPGFLGVTIWPSPQLVSQQALGPCGRRRWIPAATACHTLPRFPVTPTRPCDSSRNRRSAVTVGSAGSLCRERVKPTSNIS